MTEDSFADTPVTIGEIRSDKSNKAKDWSVRDMLIHVLREIDSGGKFAKYDRAIIVFAKLEEGNSTIHLSVAGSQNALETNGMLAEALSAATS